MNENRISQGKTDTVVTFFERCRYVVDLNETGVNLMSFQGTPSFTSPLHSPYTTLTAEQNKKGTTVLAIREYLRYHGENKGKVQQMMSFGGISVYQGTIIAFADSRSSRYKGGMFMEEEKERGQVKKILVGETFLSVAIGNNTLIEQGESLYLETWFQKHRTSFSKPEDMFFLLRERLMNPENEGTGVSFLTGYYLEQKGERIPVVMRSFVSWKELRVEWHLCTENEVIYDGDKHYIEFLGTAEEKEWYRKEDSLLHKGEEQIKEILERTIRGFDKVLPYNPVGLPIQTKRLEK